MIVSKGIPSNSIKVNFLEYQGLSDHKPIEVIVKLEGEQWVQVDSKIYIKNKKFLEQQSVILLDRIYGAKEVKETYAAFASRQLMRTRWINVRPQFVAEKIVEIDSHIKEWNADSCRDIWRKMFDNFFYNQVIKKDHIKFSKE